MRELSEKFVALERRLSQERGEFSLVALFLREDATNKWDLIMAAPWIDEDRTGALPFITTQIQQSFSSEELAALSRVVLVEQSNPAIAAINQAVNCEHGQIEIRDSNFFGLQIRLAYIITSRNLAVDAEVPA